MQTTRQYFTLVEILIVMGLLAVIVGAVGFSLNNAVNTERFRSSVGVVVDKLRMAQDIMLILRTSVRVKFEQKSDGLLCEVIPDGGLSPALNSATAKPLTIPGINSFQFTDSEGVTKTGKVTLDFLFGGSVMSRGKLVLSFGSSAAEIYLPGYPRTIHVGTPPPGEWEGDNESPGDREGLYPREVREQEQKRHEQNSQATHPTP